MDMIGSQFCTFYVVIKILYKINFLVAPVMTDQYIKSGV